MHDLLIALHDPQLVPFGAVWCRLVPSGAVVKAREAALVLSLVALRSRPACGSFLKDRQSNKQTTAPGFAEL